MVQESTVVQYWSEFPRYPYHPVMVILHPKASQSPFLTPAGPGIQRKYRLDTTTFRNQNVSAKEGKTSLLPLPHPTPQHIHFKVGDPEPREYKTHKEVPAAPLCTQ